MSNLIPRKNSDDVPNFTLSLALFDIIPVSLYFISIIIMAEKLRKVHRLGGIIFYFGAVISLIAGLLQVLWKLIIVLGHKNILPLHKQMKFVLSFALILFIIAAYIARSEINWREIKSRILSFPCTIFLGIFIVALIAMSIFIFTLEKYTLKTHWIVEWGNIVLQGSVLLLTIYASKDKY